jgi:cytochrome b6-f complex iron-sulfur subunit
VTGLWKGVSVEKRFSRGSFIRLGGGALGAAGTALLAACGGGSEKEQSGSGSADQPTEPSDGANTGEAASGGRPIAPASDVESGSAIEFEDAGEPAVLVLLESGNFVAYSAVCTHQGCTVGYEGEELVCPCHGSIFDPANGAQVVNGPASRPLPVIPVEVRGGEVFKA